MGRHSAGSKSSLRRKSREPGLSSWLHTVFNASSQSNRNGDNDDSDEERNEAVTGITATTHEVQHNAYIDSSDTSSTEDSALHNSSTVATTIPDGNVSTESPTPYSDIADRILKKSSDDNGTEDDSMPTAVMESWNRRWYVLPLLMFPIFLIAACFMRGAFVEDQWFVLANGRYLMENGFPYENPFSAWGGRFVMENWLWSVIIWLMWSLFGQFGMVLTASICATAVFTTVWRQCTRRLGVRAYAPVRIAVLTLMCLIMTKITLNMRTKVLTILLVLLSILCMRKLIETGRKRYAFGLIGITVLSMNLQMPLALLTVLAPGCWSFAYTVSTWKQGHKVFLTTGFKLLGLAALQVVSTLLNPYGMDGALFVFNSLGASKDSGMAETQSLLSYARYIDSSVLVMFIPAMLVLIAVLTGVYRKSDWESIGTVIYGTAAILGTWIACYNIIMMIVALGCASMLPCNSVDVDTKSEKAWRPSESVGIIGCTIMMIAVILFATWSNVNIYHRASLWSPDLYDSRVVDMSSEHTSLIREITASNGIQPGEAISNEDTYSSYLVYLGYRTSDDIRKETLGPAVTGLKTDYIKESRKPYLTKDSAREYLSEYRDDYRWWLYGGDSDTSQYMLELLSKDDGFKLVDSKGPIRLYERIN